METSIAMALNSPTPNENALTAESTKIGGSVFLRNGFNAEGTVNFLGSDISKAFQWRDALSPEKAALDLRYAKVGTLWDDAASWPPAGKLFLSGFTYDQLDNLAPLDAKSRIEWLKRQSRESFLPQPYEQLASVFRTMGHEEEARNVLIQKSRDYAHFTHRFSQEWFWYRFAGKLIGYGYKPWRAFFMSLAVIAFGTWLFGCGYTNDLISPAEKDAKRPTVVVSGRPRISDDYPKFNALVYSLESFTPLLKLDQSANWTPNANRGAHLQIWHSCTVTTGGLLRIYLWIHIITGWVLTSLWVGALTGLVKS